MTKPTEGPYRVNKYGSIGAGPLGTTPIIATVEPLYGADKVHGDHAANARLLAKSWEMREALKRLTHGLPDLLESIGYADEENLIGEAVALLASIDGDSQ